MVKKLGVTEITETEKSKMAAPTKFENFLKILQNEALLLDWMAWVMIATSFIVIILLLFVSAPYGRYTATGNKYLTLLKVPVKVAWFLQELPSFTVPLGLVIFTESTQFKNLSNKILITMFLLHYSQRALLFPFLIRGGKPTPFLPFFLAFVFCAYNGYMQGRMLTQFQVYSDTYFTDLNVCIGVAMFIMGMSINLHSDHVLRNLRAPGETGYKIPRGGMFEYVSGANFFGEILEWSGFALACLNLQAAAFALFTFCNLVPRAYSHHQWYLQKFEDYPKQRKAVIPYIL
ncbi:unnamed protein product [Owenia fusiformis]|uniref:3-oxo-5alpha-steroid 4-dehydrogenase (NADP(+)) n=1 Tax=Owenia fusiformis TaxID=6347 RepID=A0A8J1UM18_OWEFU|nr:unnamed protein product [Owenia fusiformis]